MARLLIVLLLWLMLSYGVPPSHTNRSLIREAVAGAFPSNPDIVKHIDKVTSEADELVDGDHTPKITP